MTKNPFGTRQDFINATTGITGSDKRWTNLGVMYRVYDANGVQVAHCTTWGEVLAHANR